jgi:hypothetical protein
MPPARWCSRFELRAPTMADIGFVVAENLNAYQAVLNRWIS